MSSSPKKSCRQDTWKQRQADEFNYYFSLAFITQVNWIITQMAAAKSNDSFLLLGAERLVQEHLDYLFMEQRGSHSDNAPAGLQIFQCQFYDQMFPYTCTLHTVEDTHTQLCTCSQTFPSCVLVIKRMH